MDESKANTLQSLQRSKSPPKFKGRWVYKKYRDKAIKLPEIESLIEKKVIEKEGEMNEKINLLGAHADHKVVVRMRAMEKSHEENMTSLHDHLEERLEELTA